MTRAHDSDQTERRERGDDELMKAETEEQRRELLKGQSKGPRHEVMEPGEGTDA